MSSLTKICGPRRHQGHLHKRWFLPQPPSGGKVLILFVYPSTNSGLTFVDDEGISPTTLEDDLMFKPSKRARTRSPDSVRRPAAARVKERVRARTEEYIRRANTRRDARNQAFMEDIIAEMPEEYVRPGGR
jgi:hypothetical protein